MSEADGEAADGYQTQVKVDISACLTKMGCQPILFAGSGLSRRYFSAPSWDELLTALAKNCPLIDKDYAYYKQTLKSPLAVGQEFAKIYQQWAWGTGKNQFPSDMFSDAVPEEAYIKYAITQHLSRITPPELSAITDAKLQAELGLGPINFLSG
ncbi:SIR2 family protein, partial [Acidisphaera rubrifaciens]|uniref:hypothetical protein n=1 Tax=Acidisphaera rubrifaciens TaxID=50715 RepID=UPI0006625E33